MTTLEIDRYLSLGWTLLPCWHKTKIGVAKWDHATSDRRRLARMVASCSDRYGRATNLAVVCGPASGVLVVDVDGAHDEMQAMRKQRGLPLAPMAMSGGGAAGYHLYFRYPAEGEWKNHGRLSPRIEVRGNRHLVLLPPSRHDKTGWPYWWAPGYAPWEIEVPPAPAWILEALRPPAPVEHEPIDVREISDRYIAAALDGEVAAVVGAMNGQRNHTLNRSTFGLARFVCMGRLDGSTLRQTMLAAAMQAGLPADEALATINSAINGRMVQ